MAKFSPVKSQSSNPERSSSKERYAKSPQRKNVEEKYAKKMRFLGTRSRAPLF
jgi:hypothetical protein